MSRAAMVCASGLGRAAAVNAARHAQIADDSCCGEAQEPCCEQGGYGYLRVRRLPGGQYQLLGPPAIGGRFTYFLGESEHTGVRPTDAYVELGASTFVGAATLCSEEPEDSDPDVFRASSWTGTIGGLHFGRYGGVPHFGGGNPLPPGVESTATGPMGLTITPTRITSEGHFQFVVAESPPAPTSSSIIAIVDFSLALRWDASTGFVTGRVGIRHVTREAEDTSGLALYYRSCEISNLSGCMDLAVASPPSDSVPWAFAWNGSLTQLSVDVGFAEWSGGTTGFEDLTCGAAELYLTGNFSPPTGLTSLAASNFAVSGSPVVCDEPRVFSGATCLADQPPGPCVIGGIVRPPVCCVDPTLPECQTDYGDCCPDGASTPSGFVFLPQVVHRLRAAWTIYRYSTVTGTLGRLLEEWSGGYDIFVTTTTAAGCRFSGAGARNYGVPPQFVPGMSAIHIVYPTSGTPQGFGNQVDISSRMGEDALWPNRAGFIFQVRGENNENICRIDVASQGPSLPPSLSISGVQGLTNTANRVATPRMDYADPFNGSIPLWRASNAYVQTIGNPPSNWPWRVRVAVLCETFNYARCPRTVAALAAPGGPLDPAVAAALARQLGGCRGCGDPGVPGFAG